MSSLEADILARRLASQFDVPSCLAVIPTFQNSQLPLCSTVAFYAISILEDLARASDDVLWDTYGSVISKWPGSPPSSSLTNALSDERDHVLKYRQTTSASTLCDSLARIRSALAQAKVEYVPYGALSTFAKQVSASLDDIVHSSALHYGHAGAGAASIYLLPLLVEVEKHVCGNRIAYGDTFYNEQMESLVVSIAKTTVHESRRLVGTALYGLEYTTPKLVQGSYWEATRYGAYTSLAMCLPRSVHSDTNTSRIYLQIIGDLAGENLSLRYLMASTVKQLANSVRNHTFIGPAQIFFTRDRTESFEKHWERIETFPEYPALAIYLSASHDKTQQSRMGGSQLTSVSISNTAEKGHNDTNLPRLGYNNFRGVLR
ncbi:hypothetical protein MKEN_01189800 [Mycena kentingensis (nom. inval.)]|nr:hypothetical protein MKEN_01189800 [Mycena kentingensis (nom. inval.)]